MRLQKHGGVEVLGVCENIPTGQGGSCMGAGWEDLRPVVKGLECHGKDFFLRQPWALEVGDVERVPEK